MIDYLKNIMKNIHSEFINLCFEKKDHEKEIKNIKKETKRQVTMTANKINKLNNLLEEKGISALIQKSIQARSGVNA